MKSVFNTTPYARFGDKLYAFAIDGSGWCVYDLVSGSFQVKKEKRSRAANAYSNAINVGDRIVFSPYYADEILILNPLTEELEAVKWRCNECLHEGYRIGDILYLIGNIGHIVRLDMVSREISEIPFSEDGYRPAGVRFARKEQRIYFPGVDTTKVASFDLESEKIQMYYVQDEMKLCNICYDGREFLLSGKDHYLIRWDPDSGKTERIVMPQSVIRRDQIAWDDYISSFAIVGDYVFAAPLASSHVLRIEKGSLHMETMSEMRGDEVIWNIQEWNGDYLYIPIKSANNGNLVMDMVIDVSGNMISNGLFVSEQDLMSENEWFGLKEFMQGLSK